MNCSHFRQFYSDFTDGLLDEAQAVAFHVHMAECVACRRFDAALEQGRAALRHLEPPVARRDFESRLFDRILRLDEIQPQPALRQWSGMAGAVLVVAVVGVVGLNVRAAIRPAAAPFRQATGVAGQAELLSPRLARDSASRSAGRFRLFPAAHDTLASLSKAARPIEVSDDSWMKP